MKDPTVEQLRKRRKLLRVADKATKARMRKEEKMAKLRCKLTLAQKAEEKALADLKNNINKDAQQPEQRVSPSLPKPLNAAQSWVRLCEADAAADNVSTVG